MKLALLAAAAALAVPAAFAQSTTVQSTTITSTTAPIAVVSSPVSQRPLRGAVIAQGQVVAPMVAVDPSGSTAVMGAGPVPVTRYWFNVPGNIGERADFQRWQRLL